MTPRDEVRKRIVGDWLTRADSDLAVAERLLGEEGPFCNAVAFHCQQAAEKYLKALLTLWGIEFPKTHVIAVLLKLVQTRDAELAESLMDTVSLTPYGVELRYPGDRPDVVMEEAKEAVRLAILARDRVRTRIT
jgi:HEPN domain-containing protein